MKNNIGEYISDLRKKKGFTQAKLADIIGVSDKTISKWERDEGLPDVGILRELAIALDTSVDSLLNGSPVRLSQLVKGLGSGDDIKLLKYLATSALSLYIAYRAILLTFAYSVIREGFSFEQSLIVYDEFTLTTFTLLLVLLSYIIYKYFSKKIYGSNINKTGIIPTLLRIMWLGPILLLSSHRMELYGSLVFNFRDANVIWFLFAIYQFYKLMKPQKQKTAS